MNINEAQKILNKAGYLLEDKYMDEMLKDYLRELNDKEMYRACM